MNNGNVIIGTTTPGAPLDVTTSVNGGWASYIQNLGTTNAHGLFLNIGASSTGVPLRVSKNNVSYLEVTNNGNVGIGTTSPGTALEVDGSSAGITGITLKNNNTTAGNGSGIFGKNSQGAYSGIIYLLSNDQNAKVRADIKRASHSII